MTNRYVVVSITGTGKEETKTVLEHLPNLLQARAYADTYAHVRKETLYIYRYGRTRYHLLERSTCHCALCH